MQKKILLVDDEEDVLRMLGARLRREGYTVIEARNGREAVEKAKKDLPQLILLDIAMPGMDGGEAAQVLRLDETTKNIPLIFLTCLYTKRDEAQEGHQMGKNIFVAKPYDAVELMDIIRNSIK